MIIAFATADLTLTGWPLDRISYHLRDGNLLAVRTLPTRYANLDPVKCVVSEIRIKPVGND